MYVEHSRTVWIFALFLGTGVGLCGHKAIAAEDEVLKLKSRKPGSARIKFVIESGQEVKKGDLLVELETQVDQNQLVELAIQRESARAHLQEVEAKLKQVSANDADKALAEAELQVVKLRLGLLEAERKRKEATLQRKIRLAETQLQLAESVMEVVREQVQKPAILQAEVQVQQARLQLEQAKDDLKHALEHQVPLQKAELELAVLTAELKVKRTHETQRAERTGLQSLLHRHRVELELIEQKLANAQAVAGAGRIVAPKPGVVSFPDGPRLREGSLVREGQVLIILQPAK